MPVQRRIADAEAQAAQDAFAAGIAIPMDEEEASRAFHAAILAEEENELENMRVFRKLNAEKIYAELDVVKHNSMHTVSKISDKIKAICHMSKIRLVQLHVPCTVQKNLADRVRAKFNKLINCLKIRVLQLSSFIRTRFDQWLGSIERLTLQAYNTKIGMVEYYCTLTVHEVNKVMELTWSWFNLYLSALQLSMRKYCWESKSATEFLHRFRGWYKQARKLCAFVMTLVRYIITAAYRQIGSFNIP